MTSSNCVVTGRWSCKITDYGLRQLKQSSKRDEDSDMKQLLWIAPELIQDHRADSQGTQKGDVYSFGIITQEVLLQDGPYADNTPVLSLEETVKCVEEIQDPPYRPHLDPGKL